MKKCCANCKYNQSSVGNRKIKCNNIVHVLRFSTIHNKNDCCCYFSQSDFLTGIHRFLFNFQFYRH